MRLSVVVPATDGSPTLARCVEAIRAAERPPEELIVVTEPRGMGPAAARNRGLADATGDTIAFVDSDVLVHRDAFTRLLEALEADGVVAAFGSYDDEVATRGSVSGFRNLLHHVVHQRHPGPSGTFWAGLGVVRRDAALAVGGFDADRYPRPSIEDVELGARLAELGTILLVPEAQGTHLKEWTLRSMVSTDVVRRGIPWIELMVERREVPSALNLGRRERLSALAAVAALLAALGRRPRAAALCLATQVALNRDLYSLLLRRLGPLGAARGLGCHVVHQLSGAVSAPAGLVAARRRRRAR